MKNKAYALLLFLFISKQIFAQVALPYSLSSPSFISDTTRIDFHKTLNTIPQGAFVRCGIPQGEVAPDFVLYDNLGTPFRLSELLTEGKPVLLVAVSYSCPRMRKSITEVLSMLQKKFGEQINIRLVYTIEAHPTLAQECPYSEDTAVQEAIQKNQEEGIYVSQAKTYFDRKKEAAQFIKALGITVPVLIDNPDNVWWRNFGPAPNNAYLLTPSGVVYRKYAWLDKIASTKDISVLLNNESLMTKNVETSPTITISKTTGNETLFIPTGMNYVIKVYNKAELVVFKIQYGTKSEFDLSTMMVPEGDYGLVVWLSDGTASCLPYHQEK